jgi:hypothetical protein
VSSELDEKASTRLWWVALEHTQTIFDGLLKQAEEVDFAVFVFRPEDAIARPDDRHYLAVRDNVLFEFGLFLGVLGRERIFAIIPQDWEASRPADLRGVLFETFDSERKDTQQAVANACGAIVAAIEEARPRERAPQVEFFPDLQAAAAAIARSVQESTEGRLAVLASTAGAVIHDVLQKVLQKKLTRKLQLTIHLVNPESPLKHLLPPVWPDESKAGLHWLARMAALYPSRLSVECCVYDHIPCVHGLMVDERELFLGFYRWESDTLVGAQAPYRYYREGSGTEDYFALFKSWMGAPTATKVQLPSIT